MTILIGELIANFYPYVMDFGVGMGAFFIDFVISISIFCVSNSKSFKGEECKSDPGPVRVN